MGRLFLENYNRTVRNLLPEDLRNDISKALIKAEELISKTKREL
jgi:hypothetical protein